MDIPVRVQEVPRWPIYCQTIGAFLCMAFSAYFHQHLCISEDEMFRLRRLDFAGIVIMITGSGTPPIYYMTMCE
jgi:predicted membrane channel-forming protein YqfA (hemolysin III family)